MNITELCTALGVNRPGLYTLLGMTRQHLQHYVSGRQLPPYLSAHIDTLLALPDDTRAQVIEARLAQYASAAST